MDSIHTTVLPSFRTVYRWWMGTIQYGMASTKLSLVGHAFYVKVVLEFRSVLYYSSSSSSSDCGYAKSSSSSSSSFAVVTFFQLLLSLLHRLLHLLLLLLLLCCVCFCFCFCFFFCAFHRFTFSSFLFPLFGLLLLLLLLLMMTTTTMFSFSIVDHNDRETQSWRMAFACCVTTFQMKKEGFLTCFTCWMVHFNFGRPKNACSLMREL